jgi:predicted nucleic acid-binding protein
VLLVDTSVWIELFRKPSRLKLADVGDLDDVATCLPIVQEVLQGFQDAAAQRTARQALLALPIVESPLSAELYLEAVDLYRAARAQGVTVRSSIDCLIAACALRHDLTVVHRDRDFTALATVSPLRARSVSLKRAT